MSIKLRIIHETNPRKYFPALYLLQEEGKVTIVGEHRYSIVKEWFRSGFRERKSVRLRTSDALKDLAFRLRLPFIRTEVIVMGFAPWDWRILVYKYLAKKNKVIYHTSWPFWRLGEVPRQYYLMTPIFHKIWINFLAHPNVNAVAVQDVVAASLREEVAVKAVVIPHSVPSVFFEAKKEGECERDKPLGLIYVGELSKKKGVKTLLSMIQALPPASYHLTIVGDGPLRKECIEAGKQKNVKFLGQISNKNELASTMANHDILMLLSQRTAGWEELFGIVITEALAAGLGVVATDHVGPASIFGERNLGNLFSEESIDEVKTLLGLLASDRQRLARFKRAQAGISESYCINRIADSWLDLFETIRYGKVQ